MILKDGVLVKDTGTNGFDFEKHRKNVKNNKTQTSSKNKVKLNSPEILSRDHKNAAKKIRNKLRKTAEVIVEIGNDIIKAVDGKSSKYKELFYAEIGMSKRSAQRYQQIASHTKIQELIDNNELENKTMADLLSIMSTPKEENSAPKVTNVIKAATSVYNKYKTEPDTLKQIIKELEKMLEDR